MLTNDFDNKIVLDADGNPIQNLTATDVLSKNLKNAQENEG